MAAPLVCRLHHHGPTSDEVGMRENLTRTLLLFLPRLDWSRVAMSASPIYSTTALKEEIELSKR